MRTSLVSLGTATWLTVACANDVDDPHAFVVPVTSERGTEYAIHASATLEPGAERTIATYSRRKWSLDAQFTEVAFTSAGPVHHWAFYATDAAGLTEGEALDESRPLDALRLGNALFLLGGDGAVLPDDVGLQLPAQPGYLLEIHYLNTTDHTIVDSSTLTLCAASTPREHTAALHVLGKGAFTVDAHSETSVSATCANTAITPTHLFAVTPHMHELGTTARVFVDGTEIVSMPFSVHDQRTRVFPEVVLEPGARIANTCVYLNNTDRTVKSGPLASNEMCMLLAWAWPAGSIHNGLGANTGLAVPAENNCTAP